MAEDLQGRFGIPEVVTFNQGEGGLSRVQITSAAAEAEIYLHGAHVTRWRPAGGKQVLFMSKSSMFQPAKPIRGGVPLIFPWFGPRQGHPESSAHGFARVHEWDVTEVKKQSDGAIQLTLAFSSSDATRPLWPGEFTLRYIVSVGKTLELTLEVKNTGEAAMQFEEALHTYFSVADVRQASVTGLGGVTYIDKVDQFARKKQDDQPIKITSETDRVYLNTQSACTITDSMLGRRITIEKEGSNATVVWNPWIAKAKAMPDFGDDEWTEMICVETCNCADNSVTVDPGAVHRMKAAIRIA
ncbi:MAG TPA: D-hexose-6-phosphate mutarotase [Tepidisphaeraceae bacterium]|nr:D-hexose-6-phosphate mutarotase [Tepidisphaeraceae bacterium]